MTGTLTSEDTVILENVGTAIRQGKELSRWWKEHKSSVTRIPIARQLHNPPEWNYGFLDNAVTSNGSIPVAGVIQGQLYSVPQGPGETAKEPDLEWISRQAQEFMMCHFMRLTSSQNAAMAAAHPKVPGYLAPLSQSGKISAEREGWGYKQVYYKLKKTGEIGKFPEDQRTQIVDLREVGPIYEWIVFQVIIFGFDITVDLTAGNGPKLNVTTKQPVYTVLTPDFVVQDDPKVGISEPKDGVVSTYGYGYSVVPDLTHPSMIAALPSAIDNTIETLRLEVHEDGRVWACMDFITPQPPRILNMDPVAMGFKLADLFSFGSASKLFGPLKREMQRMQPQIAPIYAGIRLINALTANTAAVDFSIDKMQLFKMLMALHYTDVYKMYNLSASHFRQVDDWTDAAALPAWAKHGTFNP